jgi:hypothetical protein
MIEINNEIYKRDKEIKNILNRISPELTKRKFLKNVFKTIRPVINEKIDLLEFLFNNNPSVSTTLENIIGSDEISNRSESIGSLLIFKLFIEEQNKKYTEMIKKYIKHLNFQNISKMLTNHSKIRNILREILTKIQDIIPELSRIKGRLKISIDFE